MCLIYRNPHFYLRCASLGCYNLCLTVRVALRHSYRGVMSACQNSDVVPEIVKCIEPPLTYDKYKGQCGRIIVIGGCREYTGAPYFAAISAMKVGADLAHVVCTSDAATVIKSYSPELIVHPVLDVPGAVQCVSEWLPRMHAVVLGPGLGRDTEILTVVQGIVERVKQLQLPLVVDADGLFLLSRQPQLIHGYTKAVLTPNIVEFKSLYNAALGRPVSDDLQFSASSVCELSRALGGVTVVRKGPEDCIATNDQVLVCSAQGSPRRCGGQGDLLSGSLGTFLHWSHQTAGLHGNNVLSQYGAPACAAITACTLTRKCAQLAYTQHGRSTTTTDLITQIHTAYDTLCT